MALDTIKRRLWKLRSWLFLMARGFSVLKGIVIVGNDLADLRAVQEFGTRIGAADLLVRTDREDETGRYPRGGFLVPLQEVGRFLEDQNEPGRHYFMLEPVHPLKDL